MNVQLPYGKHGLVFSLPDEWNIDLITPKSIPAAANPNSALKQALQTPIGSAPLREVARPGDKVGIVFSDITRPTPNHLILPAVLAELEHVPREQITLFNALGSHRPNTEEELTAMLGKEVAAGYRIVQNDAFDPSTQVCIGTTSLGHEVWLNAEFMACDVKVLTGFIEPHFFAGFSGGGKAVLPGMAGLKTIMDDHCAGMVGNAGATWGVTRGNPVWEEVREAGMRAGRTFLVNVTLDSDKQITGVFAGDLAAAHDAGCAYVKQHAMLSVDQAYDLVITSNSGYPLDLNLYQAVKGMSAASQVVKPGGAIVIAADCWDGIPDHGLFAQLLRQAGSVQELLDNIYASPCTQQDQWQVQILAQILLKADVYVYSENLTDEQMRSAHVRPCRSIVETVRDLLRTIGPGARIGVLPEGPQTIPYLPSPSNM